MAYAGTDAMTMEAEDHIIPSAPADVPAYTPSAAANAQFDTFMEPLGLSGIETASRKVSSETRDAVETVDYDTPTFLRRRL